MKNIVVTGAGKGIGKELAEQLSVDHKVIAVSRNLSRLNESDNLKCVSYDLSDDLNELIQIVENVFEGQLDVLINNAGALINKPYEEISKSDLLHIYNINVNVPFLLTQGLLPFLKNSKEAHVVNIGSMGGVNGTAKFPGLSAYSSSKGALSCLSECLAEELKGEISVNCLALGAVQTEMLMEAFPGYEAPLLPEQMANYIADFSLNGHKYINGKTIPVSLSTP